MKPNRRYILLLHLVLNLGFLFCTLAWAWLGIVTYLHKYSEAEMGIYIHVCSIKILYFFSCTSRIGRGKLQFCCFFFVIFCFEHMQFSYGSLYFSPSSTLVLLNRFVQTCAGFWSAASVDWCTLPPVFHFLCRKNMCFSILRISSAKIYDP